MNANWKFVSLGDRKYHLETPSGRLLGWIHGHAVGLLGLRDADEALMWAPVLRQSLDDMLAREYPGRQQPVRGAVDLRLVHDGAYEWIATGNAPIARLRRPSSERNDGCFAVEFVLPSYASERVTIAGATILANALYERILSPLFTCEAREPKPRAASARPRRKNKTHDALL